MVSYNIIDRDGNPNVFNLERDEDGLWLNDNWMNPENRWNPENEFVFVLRKSLCFRARQYILPGSVLYMEGDDFFKFLD